MQNDPFEEDYYDLESKYNTLEVEFEKAKAIVKFFTGHLLTDKEIQDALSLDDYGEWKCDFRKWAMKENHGE